ncbi:cyclin-dependent kinase inhibitor 1B-like isoform 1-T1 [Syngnathus typhle]
MNTVVSAKLVRKCLFGAVDRDQVDRDLERNLQQSSQDDSQRWNFNFKTETPLPGSLQWEKNPVERIAAFYHESKRGQKTWCTPKAYEESDTEDCPGQMCPPEVTPGPKKRTLPKSSVKTTDNETTADVSVPAKQRCAKMVQIHV